VYAHVVQVPCSPMSPVMVALKALPPVDEIRPRTIRQSGSEAYQRSDAP
jgi:hypothetical protein